jgi:AbrB family looped-hinge helix DNA binding protein
MSKVTSKLQVTIPKSIADRYSIAPGDEVEWEPTAEFVRIVPAKKNKARSDSRSRLRLFDAATKRQRAREAGQAHQVDSDHERGWTREELYERGSTR